MTTNNQRLSVGGAVLLTIAGTWEGASQFTVYADRVANNIATVCRGHTGKDLSGVVLKVGTPYTKEECARIDKYNAVKYSSAILYCVKVDINQETLDALSLFAWNVGIKGACIDSQAIKLINQGKVLDGCKALATNQYGRPAWSMVGNKYVQGLQNRRLFERDLCLKGANKAII